MSETRIVVEIDQLAEAAYVRFSNNRVVRTEELDDATNIDLDEHGMVVGVELLDLSATIPFDLLADRAHIDSRSIEMLRQIAVDQGKASYAASDRLQAEEMGSITPRPLMSC
jgi:uncharacterized protein YuzE